jgi:hypothetical protein
MLFRHGRDIMSKTRMSTYALVCSASASAIIPFCPMLLSDRSNDVSDGCAISGPILLCRGSVIRIGEHVSASSSNWIGFKELTSAVVPSSPNLFL